MNAYSWIFCSGLVVACGGSAFTSVEDGGSGGDTASGGTGDTASGGSTAGVLGRAGKGSGGSLIGNGGKTSSGGTAPNGGAVGVAGTLGVAGDLVSGGSVSTGGSDTGTAGAPPDPIDKVCPASAPSAGAGCVDGLVCTYGDDVRPSCRPIFKCDGGKWSVDKPSCEDLHGCGAIQVGKECSPDAKPCLLDTGIYCVCTGCTGAGGACSNQTVWACAGGTGGQACPVVPPNKGQSCLNDAQVCPYGSCSTANKMSAVCSGNGTWSWAFAACPL